MSAVLTRSNEEKIFHSIIIGGGHNGLVCAAYLARAGKSVLVLESAEELGGAARNRQLSAGFTVSAAAHFLHGMPAELLNDLNLHKHGLAFVGRELTTIALSRSAAPVVISNNRLDGIDISAEDSLAYARFTQLMQRYAKALRPVFAKTPPRLSLESWSARFDLLKLAFAVRRLGREDMRELLRIIGMNIYDLLDENFESPALKGALALDAVLGAEWGPRAPGTVLTYLYRLSGLYAAQPKGVAQPAGGMASVCKAIASAARAAGAQIRCQARVKQILVQADRASGVELVSGEKLYADHIISNADPRTTFLSLLKTQHLDAGFVRRVQHVRARGKAGKLHLALKSLPSFTGLAATALGERLLIAPHMDYVERAYNPSKYGDYPEQPALEISIASVRDPSLAPQGAHVLSAVVQFLPYDNGTERDNHRTKMLATLITTLEQYAPGIRDLIVSAELLTPYDIEQEFGMTGGHWHHAALALDQFFFTRPVPGAAQYATPVPGLFLCGAGAHPGGGVMGVAGRNAAQQVLSGEN